MTAWYNEIDPRMANVLRELISEGHIAPGVVDERSIVDVRAEDLRGFTQCHFFAGIGVWSHALRRAGWPDDRPCWTGSCPCQPFSLAGKGGGFDDPRHLWPHWFRLIGELGPGRIFGEQVASAGQWLDLVATDLESRRYAFAAVDLAAAGFAGAHIRQRFFWVADAYDAEWWADHAPRHVGDWPPAGRLESYGHAAGGCPDGWVADPDGREPGYGALQSGGQHGQLSANGSPGSGVGNADEGRSGRDGRAVSGAQSCAGRSLRSLADSAEPTGPTGGLGNNNNNTGWEGWQLHPECGGQFSLRTPSVAGADWILCRDGALRPVEPGTFPLVAEAPARLGRLHGYGNAIDAETCTQFLSAYIAAAENRP